MHRPILAVSFSIVLLFSVSQCSAQYCSGGSCNGGDYVDGGIVDGGDSWDGGIVHDGGCAAGSCGAGGGCSALGCYGGDWGTHRWGPCDTGYGPATVKEHLRDKRAAKSCLKSARRACRKGCHPGGFSFDGCDGGCGGCDGGCEPGCGAVGDVIDGGSYPIEGVPVEGVPVDSYPVEGVPFEGVPVEGTPIEGTPLEGAPVEGAPVESVPGTEATPPVPESVPGDAETRINPWQPYKLVGFTPRDGLTSRDEARLSRGLHAFWSRDYDTASRELGTYCDSAENAALPHYFLALALRRLGDDESSAAALELAVELERRRSVEGWGRHMQRIQGHDRLWIENARRLAGVTR